MDSQTKDDIFRNPTTGRMHFGRVLRTAADAVGGTASAVQMGVERRTCPLIVHVDPAGKRQTIQGPGQMVHRPTLAGTPGGKLVCVWNEARDPGWAVVAADVDLAGGAFGPPRELFVHDDLLFPPTAVLADGQLQVAFAARIDGRLTVMHLEEGQRLAAVSSADCDAHRPTLAAGPSGVWLAWDRYRDGRYEVLVAHRQGEDFAEPICLGASDERWFSPRLAPAGESALLAWVAVRDVTDDLGVVDHWPATMAAAVSAGGVEQLVDTENAEDQRIVADLREGQLASKIYKGYVGLRRNPHPVVGEDGTFWITWEMRPESPESMVAGWLMGRRYLSDGRWTQPTILHEGGYCHAPAPALVAGRLPAAWLEFTDEETDIVTVGSIDPAGVRAHPLQPERWNRWSVESIQPPAKPTQTVAVDGQDLKLVWADTHCHSCFSADAEGEQDELIHFARDAAGLDAITLIDNDYYPHKALTEPEWRIHQGLANHFTEDGAFVQMPGFEFTYHRADLEPDFNHRCVIYPRQGRLLRRIDPETRTDAEMIAQLKAIGGMAYPHHCSYRLIDEAVEWNIEAVSSWRVCLAETDFTIRQLRAGKRVGFLGTSDTHRISPGLGGARTGLWVTELTPEALFDAYRNRRCLATQGFNCFIDFRAAGGFIGQEITADGPVEIVARVEAPREIRQLDVFRNGDSIRTEHPEASSFELTFTDDEPADGMRFYFLRVRLEGDPSLNVEGGDPATNTLQPFSQDSRYPHNLARADGVFAWSSPVWVRSG